METYKNPKAFYFLTKFFTKLNQKEVKEMAKLTAWLVTIIGVLLVLPLLGVNQLNAVSTWLIPLAVLVIGLGKLMRNYQSRGGRRR